MGVLYRAGLAALGLLLCFADFGCQVMAEPAVARELVRHQAAVDSTGLQAAEPIESLKATCASPRSWSQMPLQKHALYTHQHWKSPTSITGIGVVYIRMPLPFPAKTVAYFAKNEYAKREKDGKVLTEGFDQFGRYWFEGENSKYHVRGYVITHGRDAWVIYSGYKVTAPAQLIEQVLADRSIETVLPEGVENAAEMARTRPDYPRATASID